MFGALLLPSFNPTPSITSFFPAPSVIAAPVSTYTAPLSTPKTSIGGEDMDTGAGLSGAAGGAATGGMIGGPIGAGVGAGLGLLSGLFGSPSKTGTASGTPGLSDALTLGLGSLFGGGGGSSTPLTVTQTQNVNQSTGVSVTNVLGREFGGGVTSEGDFDVYTALGDVFKLRDAMTAAQDQPVTGGAPVSFQTAAKTNWTPILLIGGGVVALILFMGKGK